MASSIPNVKKRSVTLPLRKVRISTCLPSQFPYTSRSLCPFLSLSSLFAGGIPRFPWVASLVPPQSTPNGGRCPLPGGHLLYARWPILGDFAYARWHIFRRNLRAGVLLGSTHGTLAGRMHNARGGPREGARRGRGGWSSL